VRWVPIQPGRLANQRPYIWDKEILWLIFFHILELQVWELLQQTKQSSLKSWPVLKFYHVL
jgi:hypothetical protein